MTYNPLAEELNTTIKEGSSTVYELLSEKGRKFFFPTKGILSQSAEAKEKAVPQYNATIGIALKDGKPIGFPSIRRFFNDDLDNSEIFSYSPSPGNRRLRELWKTRLVTRNEGLHANEFSMPVVSAGLTHAIYMAADLFMDSGSTLILPDQIWGNYRLMFGGHIGATLKHFPFYAGNGFNLKGFREMILREGDATGSVRVLLNFPNNPTGYAPTHAEAEGIVATLTEAATKGTKVLVFLDEAYFGLFFEPEVYQQSIFSLLAGAHENLLTAKICGATKELFAWGFRVGFLSFAIKNGTEGLYSALEKKAAGHLRGSISNCSTASQNIILKALESKGADTDFKENYKLLQTRMQEVKRVLSAKDYSKMFTPYPFNSGYFMVVKLREGLDAEKIRQQILQNEKIGVIATSPCDIRVAFSCLELSDIQHVFDKLYETCQNSG